MAALGAGLEEVNAWGQHVTGGGDGFLPMAGGALVVACGWAGGHGHSKGILIGTAPAREDSSGAAASSSKWGLMARA